MSPVRRRRRRGVRPTLRRWTAPFRARLRTRPVVLGIVGVVGLGLLALIWCGWTAYRVYSDLNEARDQAQIIEASLARGDIAGAQLANREFQELTEAAAGRTDGWVWSAFEVVPIFGDDAEGLATVSDVLSDLAESGIPPVLDSASQLNAGSFAPTDHQFPLDRIAALEAPAAQSSAVFVDAAERLGRIDSDGFTGPLANELDVLRDEVELDLGDARDGRPGRSADARAPRRRAAPATTCYVFQNNAEVRATGGLPGNMSLIHAEDGRVEITRQAIGRRAR